MDKELRDKKLDELVKAGMLCVYTYHDIAGDYGMSPHQALTITFPNGETIEIQSRGGCEESSWLTID